MYYDRNGKPLELMEWAKKFEDNEYKIVHQEYTWWGALVSTVWLGTDHSPMVMLESDLPKKEPIIFETMVFWRSYDELDTRRYSTLTEAENGHKQMVSKWDKPWSPLIPIFNALSFQLMVIKWKHERRVSEAKKGKKKQIEKQGRHSI